MVKGAYFSLGFDSLSRKKKEKKSGVFTKALGGGRDHFQTFRYPYGNNRYDKW